MPVVRDSYESLGVFRAELPKKSWHACQFGDRGGAGGTVGEVLLIDATVFGAKCTEHIRSIPVTELIWNVIH
jgi:hypothetical protein